MNLSYGMSNLFSRHDWRRGKHLLWRKCITIVIHSSCCEHSPEPSLSPRHLSVTTTSRDRHKEGRTASIVTHRRRWRPMEREYELQTHRAEDRHWWYRGRRSVLEGVIEELRLPARARILDAGCGSGRNMIELARPGTVTGGELSATSCSL